MLKVLPLAFVVMVVGCAKPEDPARVELRARLKQPNQLSAQEVGRVLDEVSSSLAGKTVQIQGDGKVDPLTAEQQEIVLGMLKPEGRAGVFDEALKSENGTTIRVINAPGDSQDPEYEATRRLIVDVETFLPRRFEFSYGVPGMPGAYSFDLIVK